MTTDSLAASVDVQQLVRAMREVYSVAGKERCRIPVLKNVLVEALPGRLRLTCTDLEECRVREIPALVVGQGAVTVPARLLKDLARELKRGQVELRHEHQVPLELTRTREEWRANPPGESPRGEWVTIEEAYTTDATDSLMVHYRPLNLVSRFHAMAAEEFPPLYRDIDLGDWGFLAAPELAAAA